MTKPSIHRRLYLARHSEKYHGRIDLFNAKPLRNADGYWTTYTGQMSLDFYWFDDITWDDEPVEVVLVKNTGKMLDENFVWIARDDVNGDNLCIYREFPNYYPDNKSFENKFATGFLYLDADTHKEVKRGYPPMQYEIKIKHEKDTVS